MNMLQAFVFVLNIRACVGAKRKKERVQNSDNVNNLVLKSVFDFVSHSIRMGFCLGFLFFGLVD